MKIAEREYVAEQIVFQRNRETKKTFSKDDKTVANEFNIFLSSTGQATVDRINSLANECKYNLAKPGFKPRTHGESEQFAFHTVECKQLNPRYRLSNADK